MAWGAPGLKAALVHVENAMHHLNDALKGPRAPVRHASAEVTAVDPFLMPRASGGKKHKTGKK